MISRYQGYIYNSRCKRIAGQDLVYLYETRQMALYAYLWKHMALIKSNKINKRIDGRSREFLDGWKLLILQIHIKSFNRSLSITHVRSGSKKQAKPIKNPKHVIQTYLHCGLKISKKRNLTITKWSLIHRGLNQCGQDFGK